jgi:uncharacterized membrane protein
MTYFGVNYYLKGLHSYAKGDPVPVPDFVPLTYTIIFLTIAFAILNDLRFHIHRAKNHFYMTLIFLVLQGGNVYATYYSGKDTIVLVAGIVIELFLLFTAWKISTQMQKHALHPAV